VLTRSIISIKIEKITDKREKGIYFPTPAISRTLRLSALVRSLLNIRPSNHGVSIDWFLSGEDPISFQTLHGVV